MPGRPEGVELMDSSPTMVTLAVQPPEEDGGMAVTAYRIEYDGFSTEFALGKFGCHSGDVNRGGHKLEIQGRDNSVGQIFRIGKSKGDLAVWVVNYGISNTIVLEIT